MIIRRFAKHKMAVGGLVIIIFLAICAIFAPLIAPYNPYKISNTFSKGPSMLHLLGTDHIGRDVLSRLIYGARVSLTVGLGTVAISISIGTILGLISGYFGGAIDLFIMRVAKVTVRVGVCP